jgi:membrane protease YdiL (CAAX protease family)
MSPTQLGWAALGFALVFGGNLLRVSAGRLDLSALALAPEIYLWILVGVFVEELVFRGVLQTRLVEIISPRLAIVLAALAFLAIHVPGWLILQIPVGPGTAFSIFLIGYFCGVLRYASGSVWPAVAAHLANNLGAML